MPVIFRLNSRLLPSRVVVVIRARDRDPRLTNLYGNHRVRAVPLGRSGSWYQALAVVPDGTCPTVSTARSLPFRDLNPT